MAFRTLQDWLDHQQRVHPRAIDMGLERVREVWVRMGAPRPAPVVITVGGTNGKGSTVAFLEAMLRAGGMRVGSYTSPHILRYNERVRIDGAAAGDDALIRAFERIEAARGDKHLGEVGLTYFEFGTLAAFDLFTRAGVDVALLEVGLGGRLDAVNLIDADAAVVTTVDLDHMEYLGADREAIGREKAGIFRAGRPAIIGEQSPPQSLLAEARRIGADARVVGRDYGFARQIDAAAWRWLRPDGQPEDHGRTASYNVSGDLALEGAFQYDNAAAAIAALHALRGRVKWDARAVMKPADQPGTVPVELPARLQRIAASPEVILDVAHNPQAARALAQWLDGNPLRGETHAIFGALADKDVAGIASALDRRIVHWHLLGLDRDSPRGLPVAELSARVRGALPGTGCSEHADVADALATARAQVGSDGRVLAFGSFFIAAAMLRVDQGPVQV